MSDYCANCENPDCIGDYKCPQYMENEMRERTKINVSPRPPEAMDELALQNAIRKRYCQNWPDTILQLTKRVQSVNQTWAKIMMQIMTIPGLSINYAREGDVLVVTVSTIEKVDRIEITLEELQAAQQYVEVLVMNKVEQSQLIRR